MCSAIELCVLVVRPLTGISGFIAPFEVLSLTYQGPDLPSLLPWEDQDIYAPPRAHPGRSFWAGPQLGEKGDPTQRLGRLREQALGPHRGRQGDQLLRSPDPQYSGGGAAVRRDACPLLKILYSYCQCASRCRGGRATISHPYVGVASPNCKFLRPRS
jgi:hypothetical protein